MIRSIYQKEFLDVLKAAKKPKTKQVMVNDDIVYIPSPFPSPADWRDQIIYFIVTDRFNNPDAPPKSQWDASYDGFQGGTFQGICQQLDYIKSLGCTAILLTPVFKNCLSDKTYHGYGIQDFLAVDPRLGTEEDLQNLIDQAHARGMHIVFDIVLNHVGQVFKYDLGNGIVVDHAPLSDSPYPILWRDRNGVAKWPDLPVDCHPDEGIWPEELQHNNYFFRLGNGADKADNWSDFYSLRKLNTDYRQNNHQFPVRDVLVEVYQYIIAKFDIDGFRIDSLQFVPSHFAQIFGNAIREYALIIGKKNFFTFGEVYDSEAKIARYIGRNTHEHDWMVGVDAALDFPLFYVLPGVIKATSPPIELARMYAHRKEVQNDILSSHGEASRYFVTFIDNHDQPRRFYYPGYEKQLEMAIGALVSLQGICCLYYGTEQGLAGQGGMDWVREALWGKPDAFDIDNHLFQEIRKLLHLHASEPALRYGRQYFREVSGDGINFGISEHPGGILAFSRVLTEEEILIVMNTSTRESWSGYCIVDFVLNHDYRAMKMLYSNDQMKNCAPLVIQQSAVVRSVDGSQSYGNVCAVFFDLKPMEIQVFKSQNIYCQC